MSTASVQKEAGVEDFTDVPPLPILVFWLWFFAVALGAGELALAAMVGPMLTFGVVPVVVWGSAASIANNPAATISTVRNIDFFTGTPRTQSGAELRTKWRANGIVKTY